MIKIRLNNVAEENKIPETSGITKEKFNLQASKS